MMNSKINQICKKMSQNIIINNNKMDLQINKIISIKNKKIMIINKTSKSKKNKTNLNKNLKYKKIKIK